MLRIIMLFSLLLVQLTAPLPARQMEPATQSPNHKTETIHLKLSRPAAISSLEEYIKQNLPGKYNPSTLVQSVTEEGYPRLTFSFFEQGQQKSSELVDFGSYLGLTTTITPAFGQFEQEASESLGVSEGSKSADQISPQAGETPRTCGSLTSTGNPYICCSSKGNCTFAAWEMAKRHWGFSISTDSWGNAGLWFNKARNLGFPTSPTPALFSLAVSTTSGDSRGHVGIVTAVNGPANNLKVRLYDQWCDQKDIGFYDWGASSFYSGGYILNPAVNSQSMTVYGKSPLTLNAGNYDQQVLFSVSNIQGNLKAIVIFPSGYRGTLEPSGQIWVYGYQTVGTKIRLSEQGQYSIQFFNTNGVYSPLYYFQVN
jgi:surface antigen